ncbi:unnamed protein product, partial [Heterotrigona itama]
VRVQCNRCTLYPRLVCWFPRPGQGTAIKAYRVDPRIASVFPCTAQEKSPTMKFVVHAPEVHHVLQIPQQPSIPPPHPQPLNIKIPHVSAVKIPYHGPKIVQPHLIGVESHYEEPQVKLVKVPVSHHPWD